jgi:hypothetical protein
LKGAGFALMADDIAENGKLTDGPIETLEAKYRKETMEAYNDEAEKRMMAIFKKLNKAKERDFAGADLKLV